MESVQNQYVRLDLQAAAAVAGRKWHSPVELCSDRAHMWRMDAERATIERNGVQATVIAIGTPRGTAESRRNRVVRVGVGEASGQRRFGQKQLEKSILRQFWPLHSIYRQTV